MSNMEDINDVMNPEEAVDESFDDYQDEGEVEQEQGSLIEKKQDSDEAKADESSNELENQEKDPIRGTNLDEDPLTRANQLAHNAQVAYQATQSQLQEMQNKLANYERVLRNPDALAQLVQKPASNPDPLSNFQRKFTSVDQLQTPEDLYAALKEQEEYNQLVMKKEIENLKSEFAKSLKEQEFVRVRREQDITVAQVASDDVNKTVSSYKILDKNSNEFDKQVLDNISELYMKADYNPQTGKFLGKTKFSDIAKLVLGSVDRVKSRTSADVQRTIVDKTGARPVRQTKAVSDNRAKTPESFIAAKIREANSRK